MEYVILAVSTDPKTGVTSLQDVSTPLPRRKTAELLQMTGQWILQSLLDERGVDNGDKVRQTVEEATEEGGTQTQGPSRLDRPAQIREAPVPSDGDSGKTAQKAWMRRDRRRGRGR